MSIITKGITVGFDVTWMDKENRHGGVFQYAQRLITALVEHTDLNIVAILREGGKGVFDRLKGRKNFREVAFSGPLSEIVRAEKIDVIHTPVQFFPDLTFSGPMITTLHDLQHFHYPEFFTQQEIEFRNTFYKKSAEFAERVIVSFGHVKDDIVKFYDIPPEKIDVCPFGIDEPKKIDQKRFPSVRRRYGLLERYLFYSANTWRHKNHMGLIRALKLVHERYGIKIPLVCTGHKYPDYFPELEKAIRDMGLDGHVVFTGYVPEDDLHLMLKNAELAVIPTLYEAGSFPLIEAMAYEVPVICSNVTSLPATIGDERFIFDPKDIDGMAKKIADILNDGKLKEENRKNSRERVKHNGWDRAVDRFIGSYEKALDGFRENKDTSCLGIRMRNYEFVTYEVNKQKDAKINALVNSFSWKVTAPLRVIRALFKNKKEKA